MGVGAKNNLPRKFYMVIKISWVKRLLQTENSCLLKHICENVFKQFGGNIHLNAISEKLISFNVSIKKTFLEKQYAQSNCFLRPIASGVVVYYENYNAMSSDFIHVITIWQL